MNHRSQSNQKKYEQDKKDRISQYVPSHAIVEIEGKQKIWGDMDEPEHDRILNMIINDMCHTEFDRATLTISRIMISNTSIRVGEKSFINEFEGKMKRYQELNDKFEKGIISHQEHGELEMLTDTILDDMLTVNQDAAEMAAPNEFPLLQKL